MAYYYVKNGFGTNVTAGGTTKQTGSFATLGASNVYASRDTAYTAGAGAGDYICVSDAANFDAGATMTIAGLASDAAGQPCIEICVSDTNCDQYSSRGHKINPTGAASYDINFTGSDKFYFVGHVIESQDIISLGANSNVYADDCVLDIGNTSNNAIAIQQDDGILDLVNSDIDMGANTDSRIELRGGATLRMVGGAVIGTGGIADLVRTSGATGGFNLHMTNVDLSDVTGYLIGESGSVENEDAINAIFTRCELNASLTAFVEEQFYNGSKFVGVYNSSSSSAAAEYQFFERRYTGDVEDYTTSYRDESIAFTDSGTKVSIEARTTARCSKASPLVFDLPARWAELETGTTDHIDVFLASDTAFTDSEIWVEVIYPKGPTAGSSKHQCYTTDSRNSEIFDAAGTVLTDDSGSSTWLGTALTNEYKISVDTTIGATVTGLDSVPIIRVYIAEPSVTVIFDTTVELSAG